MATQTAVRVTKFDPANPFSNLTVTNVPKPEAGPGEVLVRMKLRPCNPADVFSIMGVYPGYQPKELPATFGLEGVGVVEALGPNTSGRLSVGQRVIGVPWPSVAKGNGTYQQYMVAAEEYVMAVPDGVTDEAAAMAVINPMTVVGMVDECAPPAGEWLLVTAAGSALGRMVLGLGKHQGFKTIGVVRRREQMEEVASAGADAVVCSADEDIPARVKEITGGKGAWAALECVAGEMTAKCTASVRDGGKVLLYGAMAAFTSTIGVGDVLFRNVTVKGYWVAKHLETCTFEQRVALAAKVFELCEKGVFPPFVGKVFPLEQAGEAMQLSTQEARGGKVLVSS